MFLCGSVADNPPLANANDAKVKRLESSSATGGLRCKHLRLLYSLHDNPACPPTLPSTQASITHLWRNMLRVEATCKLHWAQGGDSAVQKLRREMEESYASRQ